MGRGLHQAVSNSSRQAAEADGYWLTGVTGIVAENQDPENQHRVKVVIPSIDEDMVYDEWARQMVFCLGNGFGTAFIPPKGSEVVLFGQLGQKYNLFYASLYNEDMTVPDGFPDEQTVGVKAPGNLKLLAELLLTLTGQNIEADAVQVARIQSHDFYAIAQQLVHLAGQTIEISGGSTVTLNSDGSMTIHAGGNITVSAGGNAAVTASGNLTLQGRMVNKVGPPI